MALCPTRKFRVILGLACFFLPLVLAQVTGAAPSLEAQENLGLRLLPGFRASLFAGQELANDIFSMTLDSQGRVVVSGPGYIKRLEDTDRDGKADKVLMVATVKSGAQGLCYDGNDLYFFADGMFGKFSDATGDGVADGPPVRLGTFGNPEHGVHAMRKGPDGWWYLIGGNDSGFQRQQINLPSSPVQQLEGGALLRWTPDARNMEIIAHGFRNPYDFDFNFSGDLFTFDSDVESDFFLPWYTPTRIYHIAFAGHHGWRLNGWKRSWNRPDYYSDTVDILSRVGRGSPTGVLTYRHTRFPERFRNGLLVLDWTFGKIFFYALKPSGSTYQVQPEIFLEPIGTQGFAPTDAVVAPDGSLFVSIGGRKTRGAIYRIDSIGGSRPARQSVQSSNEFSLPAILKAPQPLDAWSRARWVPAARKLGANVFQEAVTSSRFSEEEKIRALEILTELFTGPGPALLKELPTAPSPLVRARFAWSLGRSKPNGFEKVLIPLALDTSGLVRRWALEAILERQTQLPAPELVSVVLANLGHDEKRVWHLAAQVAAKLPDREWARLAASVQGQRAAVMVGYCQAILWRNPEELIQDQVVSIALASLPTAVDAGLQLDLLRIIMIGFGDHNLQQPSREVYSAYELPSTLAGRETVVEATKVAIRPFTSSENDLVRFETARLLAMLEDEALTTTEEVLALITDRSTPTQDFHHLTVLSRLRASWTPEQTRRIASAMLNLDRKLSGQQLRPKQNWSLRLSEVAAQCIRREPQVALEMLRHPAFASPAHLPLVSIFNPTIRLNAARVFQGVAQKNPNFPWSPGLVSVLGLLPPQEIRPLLRAHWNNFGVRDEILLLLSSRPEPVDRLKFIYGLDSMQWPVVRASAAALMTLPRDPSGTNIVPALRALSRLFPDPKQGDLRLHLLSLINRQAGETFSVKEAEGDPASVQRLYLPVFDWFRKQHPTLASSIHAEEEEDPDKWQELLKTVTWNRGRTDRGEKIFRDRACQNCHLAENSVGPTLNGVAGRFSPNDLFLHIALPNREIAGPYRTTLFNLRDGQSINGIVVFESADGVILQTAADNTIRLSESEIASRRPGTISLMPAGLLKGLTELELADLYAYLKSLPAVMAER